MFAWAEAYCQEISRRNTWRARAILLGVIMPILGGNMWMNQPGCELQVAAPQAQAGKGQIEGGVAFNAD